MPPIRTASSALPFAGKDEPWYRVTARDTSLDGPPPGMVRPSLDQWKSAANGKRAVSAKEAAPAALTGAMTPLQAVRRARSLGNLMRRADAPSPQSLPRPTAPAARERQRDATPADDPPVGIVLRHQHVLRHAGPSTIRLVETDTTAKANPDDTLTAYVPYLAQPRAGTPSELLGPRKKLPPIPVDSLHETPARSTSPAQEMPGSYPTAGVYRSTRRSRSQADLLSTREVGWMGGSSLPRDVTKRRSSLGPMAGRGARSGEAGRTLRSRDDALNVQKHASAERPRRAPRKLSKSTSMTILPLATAPSQPTKRKRQSTDSMLSLTTLSYAAEGDARGAKRARVPLVASAVQLAAPARTSRATKPLHRDGKGKKRPRLDPARATAQLKAAPRKPSFLGGLVAEVKRLVSGLHKRSKVYPVASPPSAPAPPPPAHRSPPVPAATLRQNSLDALRRTRSSLTLSLKQRFTDELEATARPYSSASVGPGSATGTGAWRKQDRNYSSLSLPLVGEVGAGVSHRASGGGVGARGSTRPETAPGLTSSNSHRPISHESPMERDIEQLIEECLADVREELYGVYRASVGHEGEVGQHTGAHEMGPGICPLQPLQTSLSRKVSGGKYSRASIGRGRRSVA